MERVVIPQSKSAHVTQLFYALVFTFAVLNVHSVDSNPASCEGITEGFGCVCNVTDSKVMVHCDDTGLTSVPENLTDPYFMTFKKNNFEVLTQINYPNLWYLELSENNIRYIKNGAFSVLKNLVRLDLSHNLISGLHKGTFTGLSALKTLVLSHNPLQAIPAETFLPGELPSLQTLSLKVCALHHIEDNAFDNLPNLVHLNVSSNYLVYIPRFGPGLTQVTMLNFEHNRIQRLEDQAFKSLTGLQHLHLSNNDYRSLTGKVFDGLSNSLSTLKMRNVGVTWVDREVFANLTKLTSLDITYNMITKLDGEKMPWDSLERVLLHDNPWECSCDNSWLVTQPVVKEYNLNLNGTNMRCGYPQSLKDENLYSLEDSALKPCNLQTPHHITIAAGFVIGVVVIGAIVGAVLVFRRIHKKKKRDAAIRSNSVYRRMDDGDTASFEI